jgi:hypothetical protein
MTTTLANARIKLKVEIGASSICLLYGRDFYDAVTDTILPNAPTIIAEKVVASLHQIGGGWTAARSSDFLSVVKRGELNYYLVLDDGDEITFGRDAPQMQDNLVLLKELGDAAASIVILVRAVGFGKDDPHGSLLNPMTRLSMKQNVTALTGSGMISVLGNASNVPTHTGMNADGSPTIEIYAMEARLVAKEFHRIDTVKCAGKSQVMEWYDSIGVHGSMWGVFVPPGFSLAKGKPMGTLWDKRLVGATVHATRTLMSRHIHKALTHPSMFIKDDFGDQCRDIVSTSGGCGYIALHNIMRLVHPALCDKIVDTAIPYQGNTVSFAAHVRNMAQFIAREKLRGRRYNRYETTMMTLETLQGRFRTQMKHNAGLEFEVGHDKVNNVPFKLEMSNLATTLTSWAKELHLEVPRGTKGDRIAHLEATHATQYKVDYQDAVGVHFVGSDKKCRFCDIPGHTEDDCQLFTNFLVASRFAKQNPDLVAKTLQKQKTFMRLKPRGRSHPVNNIELSVSPDCDDVTPEGGQIVNFDEDGLICHLNDTTALYEYESDNESIHSTPLLDPIIHIDEYDPDYAPDDIDELIANLSEGPDMAVNEASAFNLPPMSTENTSGKALSR